jgi:hypothetical protein
MPYLDVDVILKLIQKLIHMTILHNVVSMLYGIVNPKAYDGRSDQYYKLVWQVPIGTVQDAGPLGVTLVVEVTLSESSYLYILASGLPS